MKLWSQGIIRYCSSASVSVQPTKHNWAASLKREVGGDIVIWMITPRAGFDVEACWIGDSGKMRKQTIRLEAAVKCYHVQRFLVCLHAYSGKV